MEWMNPTGTFAEQHGYGKGVAPVADTQQFMQLNVKKYDYVPNVAVD